MAIADIVELEDETRRILAEARKLDVEAYKLQAERWELDEQERKLRRDRELTVWHVVVIGLGEARACLRRVPPLRACSCCRSK